MIKTKEYKCINCGKRISLCNYLYGKQRCLSCSKKGLQPRLGAVLSVTTKNKISQSLKGRFGGNKSHFYKDGRASKTYYCKLCKQVKISYQTWRRNKICIRCSKIGKKNPNYKTGESGMRYSNYFDKHLKNKIRKHDNYKCQICDCTQKNNNEKLSVHHIDYNKDNLLLSNLISLCKKCHSITNGNRDYWYAYFTYIME